MGRKKKYLSVEEKRFAQNKYAMMYYEKNKELVKEKARKKYELQKNLHANNGTGDI
jgi:hypothetical protein